MSQWHLSPRLRTMSVGQESLARKYLVIVAVVAAYWFISITLVFVNKHLLNSKDDRGLNSLNIPFFVTWFQCIITCGILWLLRAVSLLVPSVMAFPSMRIDKKVSRDVLPLSVVFVAMISLNNLCLQYVDVSFYYIGRSLTTVFNVVFSYVVLRESTSFKAIVCCLVIIGGFLLGCDQENVAGSLSTAGVVFGVLASLFTSLNAIFTKKVLPSVDQNIWRLTMYNNFNAMFLFLPLMLFTGEFGRLTGMPALSDTRFLTFWGLMLVGGVFGFAIGYITGLQIQVTSPLTHNISGTAKAAAQTVIAVAWYMEVKTYLWWTSNAVVLIGSAMYTYVRGQEMKTQHKNAALPQYQPVPAYSPKEIDEDEKPSGMV